MLIRLLTALAVAATLCSGQAPVGAKGDLGPVSSAETDLVLVPLHVSKGKTAVAGLGIDAFEVLEDGELQDIAFVDGPAGPGEDAAQRRRVQRELIFLIDVGTSFSNLSDLVDATVRVRMLDGLSENFQFSIYGIGSSLRYFTGPTRDSGKLARALEQVSGVPQSPSAIFEGIFQTLNHAAARGGSVWRKVFVFSDGFDHTRFDPDLAVRAANELGIAINPVVIGSKVLNAGIFDEPQVPGTLPSASARQRMMRGSDDAARRGRFFSLGQRTGGRRYDFDQMDWVSFRHVTRELSSLVRTEYLVGYYPRSVDKEVTAHKVQVRLKDKKTGKLKGGRRMVRH